VHVSVADQDIEYQAPQELDDADFTGLGPEDLGNVAITGALVLPFWVDAKHLCKVLDVNVLTARRAVEALDDECAFADCLDAGRET